MLFSFMERGRGNTFDYFVLTQPSFCNELTVSSPIWSKETIGISNPNHKLFLSTL